MRGCCSLEETVLEMAKFVIHSRSGVGRLSHACGSLAVQSSHNTVAESTYSVPPAVFKQYSVRRSIRTTRKALADRSDGFRALRICQKLPEHRSHLPNLCPDEYMYSMVTLKSPISVYIQLQCCTCTVVSSTPRVKVGNRLSQVYVLYREGTGRKHSYRQSYVYLDDLHYILVSSVPPHFNSLCCSHQLGKKTLADRKSKILSQ